MRPTPRAPRPGIPVLPRCLRLGWPAAGLTWCLPRRRTERWALRILLVASIAFATCATFM